MKTIFLFLLSFNISNIGLGQDAMSWKIKEGQISIVLPNDQWSLDEKIETGSLVAYIFSRIPIVDSFGISIIPTISIVIETIDINMDLVNYSILKRTKRPFEVEKVYDAKAGILHFSNAICYLGNYNDAETKHVIYIVHAIKGKKGIQIICDATTGIWSKIDEEFLMTLQSFSE